MRDTLKFMFPGERGIAETEASPAHGHIRQPASTSIFATTQDRPSGTGVGPRRRRTPGKRSLAVTSWGSRTGSPPDRSEDAYPDVIKISAFPTNVLTPSASSRTWRKPGSGFSTGRPAIVIDVYLGVGLRRVIKAQLCSRGMFSDRGGLQTGIAVKVRGSLRT